MKTRTRARPCAPRNDRPTRPPHRRQGRTFCSSSQMEYMNGAMSTAAAKMTTASSTRPKIKRPLRVKLRPPGTGDGPLCRRAWPLGDSLRSFSGVNLPQRMPRAGARLPLTSEWRKHHCEDSAAAVSLVQQVALVLAHDCLLYEAKRAAMDALGCGLPTKIPS